MSEGINIIDEDFWKTHSDAWKSSGLTQEKYCEQAEINFASFTYQHRKLSNKPKPANMRFIEAKSEIGSENSRAQGFQLLLPNGVRISITNVINVEMLQSVLTIAGSLKC